MMHPDENMERRLARFRRSPAPPGLKAKILGECRRRAAENGGRWMTPRLWVILAAECLAFLFLVFVVPGRTATGTFAELSVSPEAVAAADPLSMEVEIIGEESGLSEAEKARLVRRLSLGRAGEPRPRRPSSSEDLEDLYENED